MNIEPCVHPIDVTYWNTDDGIHVECTECGYHELLGFDTNSIDVSDAQTRHNATSPCITEEG